MSILSRAVENESQLDSRMQLDELEEEILGLLQHSDLRMTPQRREIVRQMLDVAGHFSADDLVAALQDERADERASRATVYRLIPALIEVGALREVEHGYEHSHYEVVRDRAHHEHLICRRCGRVIEFVCPAIEGAIIGVCREHHFRHYQHGLEITGLCQQCQKKAEPHPENLAAAGELAQEEVTW